MSTDKYKAVWVSHSSISDFLNCPRSYFLRAIYKDPKNLHKITVMKPQLALGQVVHEVIEHISTLPKEERLKIKLGKRLDTFWEKIEGKKGGFKNKDEEGYYKERGMNMLERLENNPGIILNSAIKLKNENGLSSYWLNEEENIILCGKVDWLEYNEAKDTINIVDFKTGKNEESEESLQLPIYQLLVENLQPRKIDSVSYWYLEGSDSPIKLDLMGINMAYDKVIEVARRIKLARQINHFKCPKGELGCFACRDLERVVRGEGEIVGISEYKQDIYVLEKE